MGLDKDNYLTVKAAGWIKLLFGRALKGERVSTEDVGHEGACSR